ncbi:MAG: hypothetical protein HC902_09885 [Calothrix sp. SM1_5_4]|nr:hypothetical protein [Calothrix sp. SM1_5_4]
MVDHESRGIHMSRLYRILNQIHEQELNWTWLSDRLEQMLVSHENAVGLRSS